MLTFSPLFVALGSVLCAAVLDVLANLMLARSNGFRCLWWGVGALVAVGLAFSFLTVAVRHLDLPVAYGLWGGFGILGTSLGGWLFFGQRMKPCAFVGMVLLIGGMVALHSL